MFCGVVDVSFQVCVHALSGACVYGVREHNHNTFQVLILTERVFSCYVLHAQPVADEAFLQVSSMVDNEVLH